MRSGLRLVWWLINNTVIVDIYITWLIEKKNQLENKTFETQTPINTIIAWHSFLSPWLTSFLYLFLWLTWGNFMTDQLFPHWCATQPNITLLLVYTFKITSCFPLEDDVYIKLENIWIIRGWIWNQEIIVWCYSAWTNINSCIVVQYGHHLIDVGVINFVLLLFCQPIYNLRILLLSLLSSSVSRHSPGDSLHRIVI